MCRVHTSLLFRMFHHQIFVKGGQRDIAGNRLKWKLAVAHCCQHNCAHCSVMYIEDTGIPAHDPGINLSQNTFHLHETGQSVNDHSSFVVDIIRNYKMNHPGQLPIVYLPDIPPWNSNTVINAILNEGSPMLYGRNDCRTLSHLASNIFEEAKTEHYRNPGNAVALVNEIINSSQQNQSFYRPSFEQLVRIDT